MHFAILMAECDPPNEVADLATDLIARKAVTHELGAAPRPPSIAAFIDQEFEIARIGPAAARAVVSDSARRDADQFRLTVIRRFDQRDQ